MLDSLEEKARDASDQKLQKKPGYKTTHLTSPLLEEGDKDKEGGGEGEKEEQLKKIQEEGEQEEEEEGEQEGEGTTEERIEATMGNICSALKPPKKVRKIKKLSQHNNVSSSINVKTGKISTRSRQKIAVLFLHLFHSSLSWLAGS